MKTNNRAIALACDQADEVCELTPAYKSCRMEDGRCGICGGDWSICGCDGMLRRQAAAALSQTSKEKQ